jgi:WD40 repeat protein
LKTQKTLAREDYNAVFFLAGDRDVLVLDYQTLEVVNLETRQKTRPLKEIEVKAVDVTPDGTMAAVLTKDGLSVWITSSWKLQGQMKDLADVKRVTLSSDGTAVYCSTLRENILVDVKQERIRWRLPEADWPQSARFSRNGKYLAIGLRSGDIRVHESANGVLAAELSAFREEHKALGHSTPTVASVDFSPDSQYLAAGAWDGRIRVWRLDATTPTTTPAGNEAP